MYQYPSQTTCACKIGQEEYEEQKKQEKQEENKGQDKQKEEKKQGEKGYSEGKKETEK